MDRNVCCDHLRKTYMHLPRLVEEYIGEAEHQDGEEYWDRFTSLEEVQTDFDLYAELANE